MNQLHAHPAAPEAAAQAERSSLEASDELEGLQASPRYCPTGLLAGFALLRPGHGRCVITGMMLC